MCDLCGRRDWTDPGRVMCGGIPGWMPGIGDGVMVMVISRTGSFRVFVMCHWGISR